MFENKENRDMGFDPGKNMPANNKSGVFNFIDKNLKKEDGAQDKKVLEEQKKILDNENNKKKNDIIFDQKDLKKKDDKNIDKKDVNLSWKEKVNKLLQSFKQKINNEDVNASNILKTNLIEGASTISFNWSKNATPILFSLFISISIISLVYVGLIIWEDRSISRGTALINDTKSLVIKIKQVEKKTETVNIFQKKIGLVRYLLDEHIYWTKFFDFLEKNTLTKAYYNQGFGGTTNGDYVFSVVTDNYGSITDFAEVLKNNEDVFDIVIKGAAVGTGKTKTFDQNAPTSFELSLKINPSLFKK